MVPEDPAVRTDQSHPANAAAGARVDRKVKDVVQGPVGLVDLGATSVDRARISRLSK